MSEMLNQLTTKGKTPRRKGILKVLTIVEGRPQRERGSVTWEEVEGFQGNAFKAQKRTFSGFTRECFKTHTGRGSS